MRRCSGPREKPRRGPAPVATTLVRGAFEYQGQKCSAASRTYIPRSLWNVVRDELVSTTQGISFGDVAEDLSAFGGAVIDARARLVSVDGKHVTTEAELLNEARSLARRIAINPGHALRLTKRRPGELWETVSMR